MKASAFIPTFGAEHPHEPGIPPTWSERGRCLVCGLLVRAEKAEADLAAARREIAALREALTAIELQTTERFIERIARAALAASPAAESSMSDPCLP